MANPEKIKGIAEKLKNLKFQGHDLIVIVSAMGDTTDNLVELSQQITLSPIQREMDMLLSAGERISMALLSMALNAIGCPAISFTGSQSGVFTDGSHNNARIQDIKAFRVKEEIEKGKIVIIAGFQGVDPKTKEVTTLGRGGSDTTAVAMAAAFKAERCDILTDVKGLFSVDPRMVNVKPLFFPKLDYELTMEMAYWGARVLHYRSVELAERKNIPLLVHLSSEEGEGTMIQQVDQMESLHVRAVNYNQQLAIIEFDKKWTREQALLTFQEALLESKLAYPQLIHENQNAQGGVCLYVTLPKENFDGLFEAINFKVSELKLTPPQFNVEWCTVSLTGRGLVNSPALFKATKLFSEQQIEVQSVITTPLTLSFVVREEQMKNAVQLLHQQFVE